MSHFSRVFIFIPCIFAVGYGLSLLGEPCGFSLDCQGPSVTCLNSGVCDCSGNSVPMENLTGCLLTVEFLGDNCTEAAQCQQGPPGPWSACVLPHPSLNQTHTVCNCSSEAISGQDLSATHKCIKKATQVGDPCQSQLQCISNLGLSQCLEGRCACLSIARQAENGTKCVVGLTNLNSTCESHAQCTVHNSLCLPTSSEEERQCKCIPFTYIESRETPNKCLQIQQAVNLTCSETIQCTTGLGEFSDCQDNQCQCTNDTVFFGSHCYIKKKLGDDCILDDECKANIEGNVVCQRNSQKCTCDASYMEESDTLCKFDANNGGSFTTISKLSIILFVFLTCKI